MDCRHYSIIVAVLSWAAGADAQALLPLTEWRAQIDGDLAKVPMSREAHNTIVYILQAYERQAQAEKAQKNVPTEQPK